MPIYTKADTQRWLDQLAATYPAGEALCPPTTGAVVVEIPGRLGGLWRITRVRGGFTIETLDTGGLVCAP